jgi:arginyl-tRNA synthetase
MKERIEQLIADSTGQKLSVEVSSKPEFGHYSTAAALRLAKEEKKNPIEVARVIARKIEEKAPQDFFERIEVVPPGFVNFHISQAALAENTLSILEKKEKYGKSSSQAGKKKLQLEFISANPTGPLTMANGRGGFLGDVLGRVISATGRDIEREYYVNDAGNQIKTLGLSVAAAAGMITDEETYYHGEHIEQWAEENRREIDDKTNEPEELGRLVAKDFLSRLIKPVIEDGMGVQFDRFTSEYEDIRNKGYDEKVLKLFKEKEYAYEQDGALWLATTRFGDDKDRVLIKSDGQPTYFLVDAAHFLETAERGLDKLIILGADHHGYVSRISAVAKMVGIEEFGVIIVQLIRLIKDGKEYRMSKRKGNFVTMADLLKEVGPDAARFFFLMVTPDKAMDFDVGLAKERSLKNPVFYLQYAYVRAKAILAKADEAGITPSHERLAMLTTKEDVELMAVLARYPEIIESTASDFQANRLATYGLALATSFNGFYEKERVVGEPGEVANDRAALVLAVRTVLANLFSVIGISAPEKM